MPRRISSPSALTSSVSVTVTEPSILRITSDVNERISSRARAGSASRSAMASAPKRRVKSLKRLFITASFPRTRESPCRWRIALVELDRRHCLVGFVFKLEILRFLEAERAGDEVGRHRFDHDVEIAYRAIVVAPRHLDFVFHGLQGRLEFEEGGVGLEVGIGLGRGDQPAESRRELAFGRSALFGRAAGGA